MSPKKENFLLILASLLVAILVIEGGMRLFGWGYLYLQKQQNRIDLANSQDIVILAIGESTTAFGGTDSWPIQLERLLNSFQDERKFHVINQGVPATNTNKILQRLPDYLNKYKPNFVLAMVGANDGLTDEEPLATRSISRRINWGSVLEEIRIYRLIQRIWNGLNSEIDENSEMAVEIRNALSDHYSFHTISNLNSMVAISKKSGARLIFVQYALTKVDSLRSVIGHDVLVISNYSVFQSALDKYGYDVLFHDKSGGNFGHATNFGNRILAENVATQLLRLIQSKQD